MYTIIDKEQEIKNFDVNKITPEMLGLKATNDFAQFANEKIVEQMPEESQAWVNKGPIGVLEAGKMFADELNEFDGTYDNIAPKKEQGTWSNAVDERIAKNKERKAQRDERVNQGTGSFFDRVGAFVDRVGNEQLQAQKQYTQNVEDIRKPNQENPNIKYKVSGIDKAGNALYNEIDLTEKINFAEALSDSISSGESLPLIGSHIKRSAKKRVLEIKDKIKKQEQITQEELNYFNKYIEREYEKQIRGYTTGGQIGASWLPSMLAFGGEIALGGWALKALGLAGKGVALGSNIAKGLLKGGKANKAIAGAVGFTTGQLTEGGLNALVGGSISGLAGGQFWANYNERKLNDTMKITDRGTVIFKEAAEKPAMAFLKSMASAYVSYFTESMGGLLGAPLKATSNLIGHSSTKAFETVLKNCPKLEGFIKKSAPLLAKAYEKINNLPIKGKSAEWLKNQVKFDGFLEEIGEELLEEVINLSLGINNEEKSLENYINIFHKSPEEWAVLTGVIALQGGTISLAGNLLGHVMQKNGVEDEKIIETIANTTEEERLDLISEAIENGNLNIAENVDENILENIQQKVKNTYLASNKNLDNETLEKVSKAAGVLLSSLAQKENKTFEEIQDALPTVEQVNGYMYADESGKGYTSEEISQVLEMAQNELFNLPEDFSDEGYINQVTKEISVLQDMLMGKLNDEDAQLAWEVLNRNVARKDNALLQQRSLFQEMAELDKTGIAYDMPTILINGVEKSTINSKGKPIAKTKEAIEHFYNWFGDSLVLDENGNPLVVHHGTPDIIEIFDENRAGETTGNNEYGAFFFANDKEIAEDYSRQAYIRRFQDRDEEELREYYKDEYNLSDEEIQNILDDIYTAAENQIKTVDVYLKMENPIIIDNNYDVTPVTEIQELIGWAKEGRYSDVVEKYVDIYGNQKYNESDIEDYREEIETRARENYGLEEDEKIEDYMFNNATSEVLDENGIYPEEQECDGIIIRNTVDDISEQSAGIQDTYIAFKPEQIKSVDNRGTFDAENPNIFYQSVFNKAAQVIDTIKTVAKGKKLSNLIEEFPLLKEFSKELEPALDYYIDEMPNSMRSQNLSGKHIGKRKIIYIDTKVIGNDFVKLVTTLAHEAEHARQYKELEEAKTKKNKTKKDKEIIDLHKNCAKANKDKRDYYNKNKKTLKPILNVLKQLDKNEQNEYLKNISVENLSIYNKYYELYEIYRNDPLEIEAQKAGENAKQRANTIQSKILGSTRNGDGGLGKWTSGTRNWVAGYDQRGSLGRIRESDGRKSERYYQEVEPEQQNIFPGNRAAKKIHKVKGGYLPSEKFIELFQNADASTIIHEMGHWYLEELTKRAEYNEEIAEDLEAIRKFLKNQGEAFTREQHEKFARSFEAYILTGSSRNNKIKKVFEDFKNWLLQIYDELKNLGISTKEMPEITNLFDRLLTAEKQRSAAVFNKISAIDEKIAGIIEQQERELDKLDEIYKTNIQENNRKSDTKRKVEEYLELASKAAKKEPKEVKEFKQRYKEATLQILEVATGYDRTFISQKRNADKVEEAINNVEDKITISGGMRPEWEEFYADTGVNYETDEVGGDYELASQAWQVFQDGTYKIDDSEYSEIEEFAGQFDYLYGKALSLQGEERYVALEALYSLWSNMPALPNEYLQELMSKVQELEEGVEEAEREAFNRKNFANIPVVEHLQWFITDKIKNLKVYNPETKYRMRLDKSHRLYRFIKGATSINKAKVIVRKINEFVIEDLRNQQRAIIHKEIQKQVRINSKVVRSGSNVKGKFDWKTNSVFLELQELNKKTKQEALEEYEKLAKLSEIQNTQMRDGWDEKETKFDEFKNDFDFNLKRNFIEYKSQTGRLNENAKGQRVSNLNIQLGVKILEDIIKLKEIGREAKSEEELNKKLNKRSYRNNFVQLIREKGQKPWVRKFVTHLLHSGQSLANWETTLNAVLGSEVAQELSLLEDEAAIDSYKRKIANKLFNRIRKIYNMGKANAFEMALDYDNVQQIIDLFQAFDKEKYTILETSFDINTGEYFKTNVELTKNQLITLYGWYQNDNLRRRLETQYGAGELLTLFDIALSDSDKDLVWAVIDTLQEMYPDINEVFINETGLSLPQEQNYIPSVAERIVSDLDMLHDCIMASKSPSATKRRKTSNRIKMNPSSLMEIVLPHIDKMSRYVILQEKLNFYRAIFTNANITAAFREVYGKKDGEDLHREIKNQLEEFSFGTTNRRMGKLKEFADGVAKNFIVGSIGGSPKVAIGQLTSMINYSENMPVAQWGAGFAKSLANPVKTFKFMMKNSEYLQARLAGNTQNEIIATLTNEADKFRKVTNFFTLNVKWGDIIAITLGGKPYVDYLVSQGMSLEEAIKKFEAETMRAQQASSASSTSRWQKKQTETALGRMFWAFRTVEFQFERKVYDAILKSSRGEVTPSQAIKTIMIYRVVNPIIFSVLLQQFAIAPLLRMLFGDDDDPAETWKGLGISGALAVLTANLSHWGYFGIGASFVIQSAMKYLSKDKNMKAFKTQVPFISDVEDVTTKLLKKGGPETEDWVDAMAVGVKYGFGVPADKLVNFGEGIADIAQGRTGIGLLRVGGWGEYAATEAMTGEAPKKKKRKYTKKEK